LTVFKLIRVVLLLSVLFVIIVSTWITEKRMANWDRPILVTIFPIVADDNPTTVKFARSVELSHFNGINEFMAREAIPYGFTVTPAFRFQLAPVSKESPPEVPKQFSSAEIAWWSLKMRWWSWMKELNADLVSPDIQMFVLFHSFDSASEVGISVGMRKGRYGIVKAYAMDFMHDHNQIVFTHELLHVLGATDKYVISTGEPIFPHGYADPNQRPLFPQTRAEIMGGRIPLNYFLRCRPSRWSNAGSAD